MLILTVGVALWWLAHLWRRIMPGHRARVGETGKAYITGLLVLSVILMVWGYKLADGALWWAASAPLKGINNLLVLIAFYLFAAAGMKTGIARHLRHPQLTGFALWAFAHLLVNGDLASVVLFGALGIWAVAEVLVINAREPNYVRYEGGTTAGIRNRIIE